MKRPGYGYWKKKAGGREYWYVWSYFDGGREERSVGPVDDPESKINLLRALINILSRKID